MVSVAYMVIYFLVYAFLKMNVGYVKGLFYIRRYVCVCVHVSRNMIARESKWYSVSFSKLD